MCEYVCVCEHVCACEYVYVSMCVIQETISMYIHTSRNIQTHRYTYTYTAII
jgi:hypothetical protein